MIGCFNPRNIKQARHYAVALGKQRRKEDKVTKEINRSIEFAICTGLTVPEIQTLLANAIKNIGDIYELEEIPF
ncbi:hypothetical protein Q4Q94_15350 [Morganella morganii]